MAGAAVMGRCNCRAISGSGKRRLVVGPRCADLASMQFDKMDTDRKGVLSEADVMKLFGGTATK